MSNQKCLLAAVGLVLASDLGAWCQDADNERVSKAAIIGYASNIQDFPFYRVKYLTTKAESATAAEALKGTWRNAASVETTYIVDGELEGLLRDAGPMPPVPKLKPGGDPPRYLTAPFSSEQYIAGEPGSASYVEGLNAINLFRREDGKLGMATSTPLSMGLMGHRNRVLGPDVLEANRERFRTEYLGTRQVDGMQLVGARFTRQEPVEVFEFWFDPSRGHLPARIYATTVKKTDHHHVSDGGQCV